MNIHVFLNYRIEIENKFDFGKHSFMIDPDVFFINYLKILRKNSCLIFNCLLFKQILIL